MSHESVISGLKELIKRDLVSIDPKAHARHIIREGERTSIILAASTIEQIIVYRLQTKMPSINSDERDRLFNFEGPCGSFSNRIRMAQALGIVDRPTRRNIDIIKEMRNAAAHSHLPIDFATPQIVEAVAGLFPPSARDEINSWPKRRVRAAFTTFTIALANVLSSESPQMDVATFWEWLRVQKLKPQTWRGKSPGASPRNRQKGKRGK